MDRVLRTPLVRITQRYSSKHKGIDLGTDTAGEPILAHTSGTVVSVVKGQKNNKGSRGTASYGNYVKLDHGNGRETLYAHLDTVAVTKGQCVAQGTVLGTMGNTGNSYGRHLHFEVRLDGERVDPAPYLADELPTDTPVDVRYRAFVGGRWLAWVTNAGEGPDGYAGIYGKPITAVQIRPSKGTVCYRVKQGDKWLPWVTSEKSHAGVRGTPVEDIEIVGEGDVVAHPKPHFCGTYLDGLQLTLTR